MGARLIQFSLPEACRNHQGDRTACGMITGARDHGHPVSVSASSGLTRLPKLLIAE
jgi:hypothetical protein